MENNLKHILDNWYNKEKNNEAFRSKILEI